MINIKLFGNSKVYKDHLKYFFHVLLLMSILTITKRGQKMNTIIFHLLVFGFGIFISFVIFTMIIFPIYLKLYRGK